MNRKGQTTMRRNSAERWALKILSDEEVANCFGGLSLKYRQVLPGLIAKHIDDLLADRARYYKGKIKAAK